MTQKPYTKTFIHEGQYAAAAEIEQAGRIGNLQARASPRTHCPIGVRIMDHHLVEARYVAGHIVWLRFRDVLSLSLSSMAGSLSRPASRSLVFEPLRDPAVFRQFQIHPEFQTLVWPNGAESPQFLRDNVRVTV